MPRPDTALRRGRLPRGDGERQWCAAPQADETRTREERKEVGHDGTWPEKYRRDCKHYQQRPALMNAFAISRLDHRTCDMEARGSVLCSLENERLPASRNQGLHNLAVSNITRDVDRRGVEEAPSLSSQRRRSSQPALISTLAEARGFSSVILKSRTSPPALIRAFTTSRCPW